MSRARGLTGVCAGAALTWLVLLAASNGSSSEPLAAEATCHPSHVPGLGQACLLPDGLFQVFLADGSSLYTHGPDPVAPAPIGFGSGSEERDPVCALEPHHTVVLYGYPSDQTNRTANVVNDLIRYVKRTNAVLHADAIASGGVGADYRVQCDASQQVSVGSFVGPKDGDSDFDLVTNAARQAGYRAARTDYMIFYDDTALGLCGVGSIHYDDRLSADNANLPSADYGVVYANCWGGDTPMHENAHNQGAVQRLATMSDLNGHCLEGRDVMCYTSDFVPLCTDRLHYDCHFDTYFHTNPPTGNWLATHWNIGSRLNPFLAFEDTPGSTPTPTSTSPASISPASTSSNPTTASVPSGTTSGTIAASSRSAHRSPTSTNLSDEPASEESDPGYVPTLPVGLVLVALVIVVVRRRYPAVLREGRRSRPVAGLIGLTSSDIELQDALGARFEYDGEWIPHPVVRLTTTLPIAIKRADQRVIVRARWGFNVGTGRPVGNARDDRLLESRLWTSLLGKGQALFAATAIYEQIREPKKTSYWFRRRDRKPIIMPGLAGERGVNGDKQLCAAIVTTTPNTFFKTFHDRQVCTLDPHEFDDWLNETDPKNLHTMLHPPADDEWEAVPIDDRIFSPGRREMEDLIEIGPPVRHGAKG